MHCMCFERRDLLHRLNVAHSLEQRVLNDEAAQVVPAHPSSYQVKPSMRQRADGWLFALVLVALSSSNIFIADGVRFMHENAADDALLPVFDYGSRFDRTLVADYSYGSDRFRRRVAYDGDEDLSPRRYRSSVECGIDQFAVPKPIVKGMKRTGNNSFYIYALTEDCQIVIARPDQLPQIPRVVKVDRRFTQCQPQFVQLHWYSSPPVESQEGSADEMPHICENLQTNANSSCGYRDERPPRLELLLKRSERQICSLPIEFPPEEMIAAGDIPFTYSLRAAVLNFAVCSMIPNSSFQLQPELSFADSLYEDVLYFIDPTSKDTFWTARQFKRDFVGYLHLLDVFEVHGIAEGLNTSNFDVATDPQKRRLFFMRKQKQKGCYDLYSTNAYDLLFRPHLVKVEESQICAPSFQSVRSFRRSSARQANQWKNSHLINSLSVNGNIILFGESHIAKVDGSDGFMTRVYLTKRKSVTSTIDRLEAKCALEVPFRAKFGIIGARSLSELRENPLSNFGEEENKSALKLSSIEDEETNLLESDESDLNNKETPKNLKAGEKPIKAISDNAAIGNKTHFKEAILRVAYANVSRNGAVRLTNLLFSVEALPVAFAILLQTFRLALFVSNTIIF